MQALNNYTYKNILRLSVPLIFGGVAQTIINITDTIFLGRINNIYLGAIAIAGLYYVSFFMLCYGFSIGTQILIARFDGEKNNEKISITFRYSLYVLLLLAFIMYVLLFFVSPYLLPFFIHSKNVLNASIDYIDYRAPGIFFACIILQIRAFYTGISQTKIIFYLTFIAAVLNVILNFALVYGYWGFPRLEMKGAALASTISEAVAAVVAILYLFFRKDHLKYQLLKIKSWNKSLFHELKNISSPLMLQVYISLASWFIFFLIVEKMGETELALSNLVRNNYMILMIPLMGFATATNTIVSNLIGANKVNEILPVIKKIIILSVSVSFLLAVVNLLFINYSLQIFTNDISLINKTLPTIWIISGSMLLFAGVYIFLSAVSGSGDTKSSLFIEIITLVFYLFASWLLAVNLKASIEVVWSVEYVYFTIMGYLSYRVVKYKIKHNKFSLNELP